MTELNEKGKELFGLDDTGKQLTFEQQGIDARVVELGDGKWKIDLPEGLEKDCIEFEANSTDEGKILDQAAAEMQKAGVLQDVELSERAKETFGITESESGDEPFDPENPREALDIIQDIVGDDARKVEQEEPEEEEPEDDEEEEDEEDEDEEDEDMEERVHGKVDDVLNEIQSIRRRVSRVDEQDLSDDEQQSWDIIKDLGDTDFTGSNEDQFKGVELLQGLASADNDVADMFMDELSDAYTEVAESIASEIGADL